MFIKLTLIEGGDIFVNINRIMWITPVKNATIVDMEVDSFCRVKESPEEILKLIKEVHNAKS